MKNRTTGVLFLAASLMVFSGCSAGISTSSSSLQREVDQLKVEVANLKDGRSGSYSSTGSAAPADMRMELDQMKTDVRRLTENVETASMGGMSLRQQLEYISARLDRLEKKAGLKPLDSNVIGGTDTSSSVPVVVAPPAPGSSTTTAPGPVIVDPYQGQTSDPYAGQPGTVTQPAVQSSYDQGKALYDQKDYKGAVGKFKEQLSKDPKGTNSPAAQFYIGESLFAQGQYEQAILEYQKVVEDYPKSSQVSTAMLKQGISFQSINDKTSAKILYEKVVQKYPKSYAAGVAKERLKTI